jgi:peptidoglycan/xylan/chitin deacetylase (PgdA/CDA1 family)
VPPHGIMFHHFTGDGHPPVQGALTAEALSALLDAQPGVIPAREWMDRAAAGTLSESDVCLTFDDSLRSAYEIASPILAQRGLTAFWFVYTSVLDGDLNPFELDRQIRNRLFPTVEDFNTAFLVSVGRGPYAVEVADALRGFDPQVYLSGYPFYTEGDRRFRFLRDEVLGPARYREAMDALIRSEGVDPRRLAENVWLDATALRHLHSAGHVIGLHSHTHPLRMAELPADDQEREYRTNHQRLDAIIGEPPTTMSHPSNSYSRETLRILAALGVRLGFRTDLVPAASSLEHPRVDHASLV